MSEVILWLRDESRLTESRTPLLPQGARELIEAGMTVVVERSRKRVFADEAYEQAGCRMVPAGSWVDAPAEAVILGLKELPKTPRLLRHKHIFFAHAFKEQNGWADLLSRFVEGGGEGLDIEYMGDEAGRRVVAFGYWAGYMGAALALMQWYDRQSGYGPADQGFGGGRPILDDGLAPFENAAALDARILSRNKTGVKPKVLVIGAGGRSGKGARDLFRRHGIEVTGWGRAETAKLDRAALLSHDIVVNCVYVSEKIEPFIRPEDLEKDRTLKVISDVSCDPYGEYNPLPLYTAPTSWDKPYLTLGHNGSAVDLIAIDNLPSLLPREASVEFAGLLLPYLKTLPKRHQDPVWQASELAFHKACQALKQACSHI